VASGFIAGTAPVVSAKDKVTQCTVIKGHHHHLFAFIPGVILLEFESAPLAEDENA